ncbi:tryptophan synthase alpha chain [Clostridia bacterium]|nr:tryptophan synthase alpha chain [Clostridia bacterium]
MNRIDVKFEELKQRGEKALITFVTLGDGGLSFTEEVVYEMVNNGADLIEIGVPFSDPVAEGPSIQAASARALANGVSLDDAFAFVARLRERVDVPLLLMLYANSVYRCVDFFARCKSAGVDGIIVPDLPYEERSEFSKSAHMNGIYEIRLVAPTSGKRIETIADGAEGFLYCVSTTGVTGVRGGFDTDFDNFFGTIRKFSKVPACVGFGIGTPEQAKKLAYYCDGAIVGSAIVNICADGTPADVGKLVKSLKEALLQGV